MDEQNNTQLESDGDGQGNLTGFFQAEADSLDATFEQKPRPLPYEVSVDLTDQFFTNLSWSQSVDFLHEKNA